MGRRGGTTHRRQNLPQPIDVDAGRVSGKRVHLTGMNEVVRSKNGQGDHFNGENPKGWAGWDCRRRSRANLLSKGYQKSATAIVAAGRNARPVKGQTWNSLSATRSFCRSGSRTADIGRTDGYGKRQDKTEKWRRSMNRRIRGPNVRWCERAGAADPGRPSLLNCRIVFFYRHTEGKGVADMLFGYLWN